MTHLYHPSKGEPRVIADMPYPYLSSALKKLELEQPHRTAEIEAMRARKAELDAIHEAEQAKLAGEA